MTDGSPGPASRPPVIYLDHNASTPLAPEVKSAMLPWLDGATGNPSSGHAFGQAGRAAVHGAELVDREQPAPAPDALLPEQHRPPRIELDPQRDANEQRPQQRQRERRAEKVEQALGHRCRSAGRAGPLPSGRRSPRGTRAQRVGGRHFSAVRTAATTRPTSASSMRV